ncbi:MAG: hypothetical protein ACRDP6_04760 [Actinoallomurus sp.]
MDGYAGRERDLRRAPQSAGRWPTAWVPTVAGATAIEESAFVTVVTWPGW